MAASLNDRSLDPADEALVKLLVALHNATGEAIEALDAPANDLSPAVLDGHLDPVVHAAGALRRWRDEDLLRADVDRLVRELAMRLGAGVEEVWRALEQAADAPSTSATEALRGLLEADEIGADAAIARARIAVGTPAQRREAAAMVVLTQSLHEIGLGWWDRRPAETLLARLEEEALAEAYSPADGWQKDAAEVVFEHLRNSNGLRLAVVCDDGFEARLWAAHIKCAGTNRSLKAGSLPPRVLQLWRYPPLAACSWQRFMPAEVVVVMVGPDLAEPLEAVFAPAMVVRADTGADR